MRLCWLPHLLVLTRMPPEALVLVLSRLETELLQPATRHCAERLSALLHPDFEECGRSGCIYTRDAVIQALAAESPAGDIVADAFVAAELGAEVALLTFRTALQLPDGTRTRHTLRASIWHWTEGRWQLRYHQGTPADGHW